MPHLDPIGIMVSATRIAKRERARFRQHVAAHSAVKADVSPSTNSRFRRHGGDTPVLRQFRVGPAFTGASRAKTSGTHAGRPTRTASLANADASPTSHRRRRAAG